MPPNILTVSELTQNIKALLEENFGHIYLQGEISNLSRPGSGHFYFNVKDEFSQISAVMFRSAAARNHFELEAGLEAIMLGRITVYEPRGNYQVIVEKVEPVGVGALQLALEQLKTRLDREGLFDPKIKKEIPFLPNAIGLVTSPTGAAIKDILNILYRRFPSIPVLLNPVLVQGDGASTEIAEAIDQFQEISGIDVLIVGRGGGSMEDLWAFNEEPVARAIFRSKIPVISAVGHETDFTIADFVADLRAPTPSAAAELVAPIKKELVARIEELNARMFSAVKRDIKNADEHLLYTRKRLRSPKFMIEGQSIKMDELSIRLISAMQGRTQPEKSRLARFQQQLTYLSPLQRIESESGRIYDLQSKLIETMTNALSIKQNRLVELTHVLSSTNPLAVLRRGYAIVSDLRNRVVTSVNQLRLGSGVWVRLPDGRIKSEVKEIIPNQAPDQESD